MFVEKLTVPQLTEILNTVLDSYSDIQITRVEYDKSENQLHIFTLQQNKEVCAVLSDFKIDHWDLFSPFYNLNKVYRRFMYKLFGIKYLEKFAL